MLQKAMILNITPIYGSSLSSAVKSPPPFSVFSNPYPFDSDDEEFFNNLVIKHYFINTRVDQIKNFEAYKVESYDKVIVFDWDDSLFPTTQVSNILLEHGKTVQDFDYLGKNDPIFSKLNFDKLEQTIITLFKSCQDHQLGICIISNAEFKWIEWCINNFCPQIIHWMNTVIVLAAGTLFKNQIYKYQDQLQNHYNPYLPDYLKSLGFYFALSWKHQAFNLLYELNPHIKQIISVGDAMYERIVCLYADFWPTAIIKKSIKMQDHPHFEQLIAQLNKLNDNINLLIPLDYLIDVMLTIKEME